MAWEYEVWFKVWRLAILRRTDDAMRYEKTRWALGWERPYVGTDGKQYRSWGVLRRTELV